MPATPRPTPSPAAAESWFGWRDALELGAVSGLLLALCFPAIDWSWLSWVALVPLLLVCLRARSALRALAAGYLAGAVFFAATCPWIYHAVHVYGGVPAALAALVQALFIVLMGAFFAAFALLGHWFVRRAPRAWPALFALLALPALWVALEWLRTYAPFGGFPWNLLGYTGIDHAGFMLSATVAGVYGAGFLIALENTVVAWFIAELACARRPLYRTALVPPFVVWALVVGFASFPYDPPTMLPAHLQAVLVQPDTSLDAAWTADSFAAYRQTLARLSRSPLPPLAAGAPPTLVLWPESPAPLDYAAEPALRRDLAQLAHSAHAEVLLGETTLIGTNPPLPVNAAQLVLPSGAPGPRYDKRHLVPFGEYVPLPAWLARLGGIQKLVAQVGDFVPGRRSVLFSLAADSAASAAGPPDPSFAALICYESIFPQLARRDVAAGAQWLVNLSDDGWYGNSSARPQGLEMARMRAVENRRWLLRDTNNGLTAIVDPYGRITARLPRDRRASLRGVFAARSDTTFYTRHGDWLPFLATIFLVIVAAGALVPRPRASPTH